MIQCNFIVSTGFQSLHYEKRHFYRLNSFWKPALKSETTSDVMLFQSRGKNIRGSHQAYHFHVRAFWEHFVLLLFCCFWKANMYNRGYVKQNCIGVDNCFINMLYKRSRELYNDYNNSFFYKRFQRRYITTFSQLSKFIKAFITVLMKLMRSNAKAGNKTKIKLCQHSKWYKMSKVKMLWIKSNSYFINMGETKKRYHTID